MPDRVRTRWCTLVISVKGVVNSSRWICGGVRGVNVCRPLSDSQGQGSTFKARSSTSHVDQVPKPGDMSLVVTHLSMLPRLWQAKCSVLWPCSPQVTPRFWSAVTVRQKGLCPPACPVRSKHLRFWGWCWRQGTLWPKTQKLWFQDHAVFTWSVQKCASWRSTQTKEVKVRDSGHDEMKRAREPCVRVFDELGEWNGKYFKVLKKQGRTYATTTK